MFIIIFVGFIVTITGALYNKTYIAIIGIIIMIAVIIWGVLE